MLERARVGHAQDVGRPESVVVPEHRSQLGTGPGVERALTALAVRVERRREPALGRAQVVEQPLRGLVGDAQGERRSRRPPRVHVHAQQERVVVEHLLEVGNHPRGVDRVPGEATGELVVQAAPGHRVEGRLRHLAGVHVTGARVVAQQPLEHHRRRELRGATEPAARGVERGRQPRERRVDDVLVPAGSAAADSSRRLGQRLGDDPRARHHLVPAGGPRRRHAREHLREGRHPVHPARREVGAAEERLSRRRREDGHRPPARARHRLRRRHVDGVDVGPLLPVHLDAHEVLVHERGRRGVLERLVRHDVAPVAGGVPDGDQHRHVPRRRFLERRVTPLDPVHRVVGVLLQVRARRGGEAVGHVAQGAPRTSAASMRPPCAPTTRHGRPEPGRPPHRSPATGATRGGDER